MLRVRLTSTNASPSSATSSVWSEGSMPLSDGTSTSDSASSVETDTGASIGAGVYRSSGDGVQSGAATLQTLLLQTVYFTQGDRPSAETLGLELYDLLTRSRKDK